MSNLILRSKLSRPLTHNELDDNLKTLEIINWVPQDFKSGQFTYIISDNGTTSLYVCIESHTGFSYSSSNNTFSEVVKINGSDIRLWRKVAGGGGSSTGDEFVGASFNENTSNLTFTTSGGDSVNVDLSSLSSGSNGTNGTSGVSGADGNDGANGTSGINGVDGNDGADGTSGINGVDGNDGADGTSGINGADGTSGINGADGTSGINGVDGNDGADGTSGINGVDGDKYKTTSVTSFTLGNAGSLTVEAGLAYTPAQSIIIVFDTNNFQECEVIAYNSVTGLITFAASTRTVGSGTYTSWAVNLDGATGGDGANGTSGINGIDGNDGADGTSGISGVDGNDGNDGADGTSGISGVDGNDGTSGISGADGVDGIDGNDGTSGISGVDGNDGIDGNDGTSGISGIDGNDGTSGISGIDGNDGADGTSGISGVDGNDGIDGADGTSGISGVDGNDGIDGNDGQDGTSGISGIDGNDGQDGTSGVDGTSGISGVDGNDGIDGNDGTSGISGVDGNDGQDGTSGISGVDGNDGADGNDGTSGISGVDGNDGADGNDGQDGTSGISGTSGVNGVSSGRIYYFNESIFELSDYNQLSSTITNTSENVVTQVVPQNGEVIMDTYLSEPFDFTVITGGVQRLLLWMSKDSEGSDIEVYVKLYLTDNSGNILGLAGQSQPVNIGWNNNNTTAVLTETDITFVTTPVSVGQRMMAEIIAVNNENQSKDAKFYTEGQNHYSYIITTIGSASGTSGIDGTSGISGIDGNDGNDGTSGISGVAGTSGVSGSGANTYIARVEFDSTQQIAALFFDQFGNSDIATTGASATNTDMNAEFQFTEEVSPPRSILAYAANTSTNEYIVTHLDGGGTNTNYKLTGFQFSSFGSPSGLPSQFDAALFTDFGSVFTIGVDMEKGNFDWDRVGFPTAKETHVYIVFSF